MYGEININKKNNKETEAFIKKIEKLKKEIEKGDKALYKKYPPIENTSAS